MNQSMNRTIQVSRATMKSVQRHWRRRAARGDALARVRCQQFKTAWIHPARVAVSAQLDRLDRCAHINANRFAPSRRLVTSHVCERLTLAEVA